MCILIRVRQRSLAIQLLEIALFWSTARTIPRISTRRWIKKYPSAQDMYTAISFFYCVSDSLYVQLHFSSRNSPTLGKDTTLGRYNKVPQNPYCYYVINAMHILHIIQLQWHTCHIILMTAFRSRGAFFKTTIVLMITTRAFKKRIGYYPFSSVEKTSHRATNILYKRTIHQMTIQTKRVCRNYTSQLQLHNCTLKRYPTYILHGIITNLYTMCLT